MFVMARLFPSRRAEASRGEVEKRSRPSRLDFVSARAFRSCLNDSSEGGQQLLLERTVLRQFNFQPVTEDVVRQIHGGATLLQHFSDEFQGLHPPLRLGSAVRHPFDEQSGDAMAAGDPREGVALDESRIPLAEPEAEFVAKTNGLQVRSFPQNLL